MLTIVRHTPLLCTTKQERKWCRFLSHRCDCEIVYSTSETFNMKNLFLRVNEIRNCLLPVRACSLKYITSKQFELICKCEI